MLDNQQVENNPPLTLSAIEPFLKEGENHIYVGGTYPINAALELQRTLGEKGIELVIWNIGVDGWAMNGHISLGNGSNGQ